MADLVSSCDFAAPEQQALCLAVERAEAAKTAAEKAQAAAEAAKTAAEAVPEWSKLGAAWVEALTGVVPWLVVGVLLYKLWPQIIGALKGGGSFSLGELKLEVKELKSEAVASVNDLSTDLMDASAALISTLDWTLPEKFKPEFDADGDPILTPSTTGKQGGFGKLNLPPGTQRATARRLHLLYVDDQEKLAAYKVGALRRRGYSVTYVKSLDDAEKALVRTEFNAVITDSTHGEIEDAWRALLGHARRGDRKENRGDKALTPFVVQTSPEKARALMRTERELRDDPRAFATPSLMLIRHRLLWLEDNEVDNA